jgi:hypothetical protein
MSFSTVETINTINEYKQKVSTRLVYYNDPINFPTADQGVQFVEGILAKTSGTELKFQDYNEMLKYINSIDYIKKVISMPGIDASKGKCINYINKLRKDNELSDKISEMKQGYVDNYNLNSQISNKTIQAIVKNPSSLLMKGIPTSTYVAPDDPVIWTYKSLKEKYNAWLNKEKQIVIPDNYQYQADKIISKYSIFVKRIPEKSQEQIKAFLKNLKFADTLFKTDKELNNKIILGLLQKLETKTKRYGPNIFFSRIDIDNEEYFAISKIDFWLKHPINSMFTINDQMVGQGINQILKGIVEKQKADQEQQKLRDNEEAKKAKEKKEKEKKEAEEKNASKPPEFKDVLGEVDNSLLKVQELYNIDEGMKNLPTQPGIEAYTDEIEKAESARNSILDAQKATNSYINAFM